MLAKGKSDCGFALVAGYASTKWQLAA